MDPTMYSLIKVNPFVATPDPGPTAVYNAGFQTPQQMKMTEQIWDNDKIYFLSYGNIHRACFRLIDELVRPEFKVSNVPGLTGWNSTMSIQAILSQLETTFGKPTANIIWNNNVTFTSPFSPVDTPESLFRRIEECQEIVILGATPYTVPQIVNNTMHLLQSGIFPTREFETWDNITPKTWPALKTFVQGAYQRKLVASSIRNTSGQMGYTPTQNAFQAFTDHTDDSSVETTVTHTAAAAATAATMGSTLGSTYQASLVPAELTAAIKMIAANQQALYAQVAPLTQQMAAMSYQQGTKARQYQATPPVQNLVIPQAPTYGGYSGGYVGGRATTHGGFHQGRGGGRGGRWTGRGTRRNGRGRTAFADYVPQGRGYGAQGVAAQGAGIPNRPFKSNLVKQHNNWNVCYSCGFDVEDGHNSMTYHMDWRKPTHDVTFTHDNAQQKLAMGCDACTRGMHKSILPGGQA